MMFPRNRLLAFALAAVSLPTLARAQNFTLAQWASDPLEVAAFYHHPTKSIVQLVYPQVLDGENSGAAGSNIDFDAGRTKKWYIEEQRGGADLVEAGVALHDERLIDLGARALDWGFARQNAAGGWDCPDTFHSATFFVEAAARAALCLQAAGLPKYQSRVADWTTHLRAAGTWMNRPEVLHSDPYYYLLTHRAYLTAAAFGETSVLTGDAALHATAETLAKAGLACQWPDGVNPEKGGYDVGYQVTGLNFALRYCAAGAPGTDTRAALTRMIARGMDFELTKMDATGTITTEGSTRLDHEKNRRGETKVIGYKPIIQALVGTSLLTGERKYRDAATLIAHAQGYGSPGN